MPPADREAVDPKLLERALAAGEAAVGWGALFAALGTAR